MKHFDRVFRVIGMILIGLPVLSVTAGIPGAAHAFEKEGQYFPVARVPMAEREFQLYTLIGHGIDALQTTENPPGFPPGMYIPRIFSTALLSVHVDEAHNVLLNFVGSKKIRDDFASGGEEYYHFVETTALWNADKLFGTSTQLFIAFDGEDSSAVTSAE